MQVYRYNTERSNRAFNNTGREKNPNVVKFYATNMNYAERYNSEDFECTLEVAEVCTENLFDMSNDFKTLNTYKKHIDNMIFIMRRDYEMHLSRATKVKDKKMFQRFIDNLVNEEESLIQNLKSSEFQALSDYELQNDLISELSKKGYKGYITTNEVAIF